MWGGLGLRRWKLSRILQVIHLTSGLGFGAILITTKLSPHDGIVGHRQQIINQ